MHCGSIVTPGFCYIDIDTDSCPWQRKKTIIKRELWLYNSAFAISSQTDQNSLCPQHFILLWPITIIINQRKVWRNWSCKIFYDVIRNFGFTRPKYFAKCANKKLEKTLESLMPGTQLQFGHSRIVDRKMFCSNSSDLNVSRIISLRN